MTLPVALRIALPVAACAAMCVCASTARAQTPQGPPSAPRESTQLSVPSTGGGLLVDFDRPEGAADPDTPATDATAPATIDHMAPGHICSTGNSDVDSYVREAGLRYGVDPCLVTAVMSAESGYRRFAVSPKGASGYMQLMPDTARRFGVADLFDPRQNIAAGTRYLRFLLDRFGGSVELALAGYNAGETAVERFGRRIPPFLETQNYVRTITGRYYSRHAGMSAIRGATTAPVAPDAVATVANRPANTGWSGRISIDFDAEESATANPPGTAPAQP